MDTIFMNSGKSKTYDPHRLLLLRQEMKSLHYLMDYILYQIFEAALNKHGEKTDNLSIRIYVSKIENKITFEIKILLKILLKILVKA